MLILFDLPFLIIFIKVESLFIDAFFTSHVIKDYLMKPDLSSYWMPFTANRDFKKNPRLIASAQGMFYQSDDGHQILDGIAGLWCCNAGHSHPKIVKAVQEQVAKLDYATAFQMGHSPAFELANRIAKLLPQNLSHVFFTNSGSESADTALKIALCYQQTRGKGGKTLLVGRERGYHGVGFGGISVGGIPNNRKFFRSLLQTDHLPSTHGLSENFFSRGEPEHGGLELANALEGIIALHGAETIAAVIVEPFAGSTGVLIPPKGYLQRLREICNQNDILLIFDEVITGFGRLGTPFAADFFWCCSRYFNNGKRLNQCCHSNGSSCRF